MKTVDFATLFAANKHSGQYRKSTGVPYIIHPLEVMKQLTIWKITDEELLIASVLHDILEDTDTSLRELDLLFSSRIAYMVLDLTYDPVACCKEKYLSDMKLKSYEAHIIKVADRLCNVRDFILTDSSYALKYLRKADVLFNDFSYREDVDKELRMKVSEEHSKVYKEIGEANAKHTQS